MAENVKISVEVSTGQAAKSLSELKKEFKEQQKALEGLTVGSKAYIEQLKKLGQTKDDIGDLQAEISALGSGQGKLKAVGNVVSGLAGGFSAATGAAALFGSQSEDVEKALLKVQAALALSQGIEQVLGLGDAFKALGNIIKANPLIALATVIVSLVTAFVGLEDIMNGIKTAFKAVGEVASQVWDGVVEGIKFAIDIYTQYLDLLTFGLFDINESYRGYIKSIDDANEAEKKRVQALAEEIKKNQEVIEQQTKLRDAYLKAADTIAKRRTEVEKAYNTEIRLAKAAGKNTIELEEEKLEAVRKSLAEEIELRTKAFEAQLKIDESRANITEALAGNRDSRFAKLQKKMQAERQAETKKQLETLRDDLGEIETQIQESALNKERERNEKAKELAEERLRIAEDEMKRLKALQEKGIEEDAKIDEERLNRLMEAKAKEVDVDLSALDELIAAQDEAAFELDYAQQQQAKKDRELFKATQDAKVQMLSDSISTLASLTELFGKNNEKTAKKAFEINKALSIADAIIKTYQAANAIFASAAANPATVLFPAQPFIAAGLAIAAGFANVAKIAQQKFEVGKSSAPSGGGSTSAPSLNTPTPNGNNSIGSTLLDRQAIEEGRQPQESRVTVLESDISVTQNRVRNIVQRAQVV